MPEKVATAEDALDAAFKVDPPVPDQPRGEDGKFVAAEPTPAPAADAPPPDAPAPTPTDAQTPAPPAEPPKKVLRYKVDKEEREVDLDAEYADETRRQALAEKLRKGDAFDVVTQRERQRGQADVLDFLRQQGYDLEVDPATGKPRLKTPSHGSPPSPQQPQKVEPPSVTDEELKRRAQDGDNAAWIELLNRSNERASQAHKRVEEWERQQREAEEQRRQIEQATQYANSYAATLEPILGSAKSELGSGPEADRLNAVLRANALAYFKSGAPAEQAAEMLSAQVESIKKFKAQAVASIPQAPKPAAPRMPGPSGGSATMQAATPKKPRTVDEALNEAFTPT